MAGHGKRCDKCNKLFRVGEWFITDNSQKSFCKSCLLDKVRCEGCFQTPEIGEVKRGEDIPELNNWVSNLKKLADSNGEKQLCPKCYEARRGEKCPKCGKTLFGGEPCFCDMNDLNKCLKCGKFVQGGAEECLDCARNRDDNKEPPKDRKPNEICEKCGASCIVNQTKTSYTIKRKRYIKHKTDFTREETCWFGTNCPCAREYREANQQTCPQCKKREFPHMKRGWMLDYEIKKAFCSSLCHVTYRELKWEEAQRLTQVEMFPPELDVETNPNQNVDWEKEGLKREVLFWREYARELEARLANQNNLTPEERQQSDYLRNLQQNTLRSAENNYRNRYGELTENGSDKGKGLSGGVIFLLIIGGIMLIGGVIFLLNRNKDKKHRKF